ncbi:hypothetical protein CBR_g39382 [Chara braunii]|uniref:Uncharacterized protein n=1 Tax=Chara braunii TaxID=69332 RepID=A0A388LRM7_CHABU|nr:hypothetical protein CBR_g39382 [Chara braunii]|eukprot:GBG84921.1 hypothetical protein CBR_g39382 [Chara braunii]
MADAQWAASSSSSGGGRRNVSRPSRVSPGVFGNAGGGANNTGNASARGGRVAAHGNGFLSFMGLFDCLMMCLPSKWAARWIQRRYWSYMSDSELDFEEYGEKPAWVTGSARREIEIGPRTDFRPPCAGGKLLCGAYKLVLDLSDIVDWAALLLFVALLAAFASSFIGHSQALFWLSWIAFAQSVMSLLSSYARRTRTGADRGAEVPCSYWLSNPPREAISVPLGSRLPMSIVEDGWELLQNLFKGAVGAALLLLVDDQLPLSSSSSSSSISSSGGGGHDIAIARQRAKEGLYAGGILLVLQFAIALLRFLMHFVKERDPGLKAWMSHFVRHPRLAGAMAHDSELCGLPAHWFMSVGDVKLSLAWALSKIHQWKLRRHKFRVFSYRVSGAEADLGAATEVSDTVVQRYLAMSLKALERASTYPKGREEILQNNGFELVLFALKPGGDPHVRGMAAKVVESFFLSLARNAFADGKVNAGGGDEDFRRHVRHHRRRRNLRTITMISGGSADPLVVAPSSSSSWRLPWNQSMDDITSKVMGRRRKSAGAGGVWAGGGSQQENDEMENLSASYIRAATMYLVEIIQSQQTTAEQKEVAAKALLSVVMAANTSVTFAYGTAPRHRVLSTLPRWMRTTPSDDPDQFPAFSSSSSSAGGGGGGGGGGWYPSMVTSRGMTSTPSAQERGGAMGEEEGGQRGHVQHQQLQQAQLSSSQSNAVRGGGEDGDQQQQQQQQQSPPMRRRSSFLDRLRSASTVDRNPTTSAEAASAAAGAVGSAQMLDAGPPMPRTGGAAMPGNGAAVAAGNGISAGVIVASRPGEGGRGGRGGGGGGGGEAAAAATAAGSSSAAVSTAAAEAARRWRAAAIPSTSAPVANDSAAAGTGAGVGGRSQSPSPPPRPTGLGPRRPSLTERVEAVLGSVLDNLKLPAISSSSAAGPTGGSLGPAESYHTIQSRRAYKETWPWLTIVCAATEEIFAGPGDPRDDNQSRNSKKEILRQGYRISSLQALMSASELESNTVESRVLALSILNEFCADEICRDLFLRKLRGLDMMVRLTDPLPDSIFRVNRMVDNFSYEREINALRLKVVPLRVRLAMVFLCLNADEEDYRVITRNAMDSLERFAFIKLVLSQDFLRSIPSSGMLFIVIDALHDATMRARRLPRFFTSCFFQWQSSPIYDLLLQLQALTEHMNFTRILHKLVQTFEADFHRGFRLSLSEQHKRERKYREELAMYQLAWGRLSIARRKMIRQILWFASNFPHFFSREANLDLIFRFSELEPAGAEFGAAAGAATAEFVSARQQQQQQQQQQQYRRGGGEGGGGGGGGGGAAMGAASGDPDASFIQRYLNDSFNLWKEDLIEGRQHYRGDVQQMQEMAGNLWTAWRKLYSLQSHTPTTWEDYLNEPLVSGPAIFLASSDETDRTRASSIIHCLYILIDTLVLALVDMEAADSLATIPAVRGSWGRGATWAGGGGGGESDADAREGGAIKIGGGGGGSAYSRSGRDGGWGWSFMMDVAEDGKLANALLLNERREDYVRGASARKDVQRKAATTLVKLCHIHDHLRTRVALSYNLRSNLEALRGLNLSETDELTQIVLTTKPAN